MSEVSYVNGDFIGHSFGVVFTRWWGLGLFSLARLAPAGPRPGVSRGRPRQNWAGGRVGHQRVIVLNPRNAEAYRNRALVLLQQGKDTGAQDDFDRCLALDIAYKDSLEQKIEELRSQLAAKR